jgi:subtilase family serine protease
MRLRPVLAAAAAAALASMAWAGLVAPSASATPGAAPAAQPAGKHAEKVCAAVVHGAACMALRLDPATASAGVTPAAATPSGLFPADLQSAYKLPSATAGAGRTIAIVDAFDDPAAESDLGVYRSQFGLPACTTANGCFRKVGQTGSVTALPRKNASWDEEISLDVDMVSATCPNCHILLVEANSASFANLGAAVNTAARLGATAISNSYGGSDASDAANGSFYNHPGIAVTASSGDGGFGVEYPASSQFVVAVGGTSLTRSATARGWTESAWSGAGSGCSAFNTAIPSAATFNTGCARRAVADVSAVADPNTGVAVFDSVPFQGFSNWLVFGGTSASSPIIASVYGLAGNAATIDANDFPYQHSTSLFDVTTGSNGTCTPTQLCKARVGWDGPTGLGTPNGTGGF